MAEQRFCKPPVGGSIPLASSNKINRLDNIQESTPSPVGSTLAVGSRFEETPWGRTTQNHSKCTFFRVASWPEPFFLDRTSKHYVSFYVLPPPAVSRYPSSPSNSSTKTVPARTRTHKTRPRLSASAYRHAVRAEWRRRGPNISRSAWMGVGEKAWPMWRSGTPGKSSTH